MIEFTHYFLNEFSFKVGVLGRTNFLIYLEKIKIFIFIYLYLFEKFNFFQNVCNLFVKRKMILRINNKENK